MTTPEVNPAESTKASEETDAAAAGQAAAEDAFARDLRARRIRVAFAAADVDVDEPKSSQSTHSPHCRPSSTRAPIAAQCPRPTRTSNAI